MSSANRLNFRAPVLTRRAVCLGLGATLLSSAAPSAHAAGWPSRSVTVVVPYAPGGNTDMMARLASQYLADKLGQPFVIENRAGGGGSVGAVAVAKAQPDGYTLLFGASTQIINIPMLQKVSYDPQKDLVPISIFGAGPYLLGVKASLPVNTLAEFIAYVKANPGKLNYRHCRRRRQHSPQHCAVRCARRPRHGGGALQERRAGDGRARRGRGRDVFRQCVRS